MVILHPRPFSLPYLYKGWIVYFVPLRSPTGAIESSQAIQKVFSKLWRRTRIVLPVERRLCLGGPDVIRPGREATRGLKSLSRLGSGFGIGLRAGTWDLLFLRNLEAVASRPPRVTRFFSCRVF